MRINVEEVNEFINKQNKGSQSRYNKAWNAFKNNANDVTAEELKKLAIDFCKKTLEDKISAIGYNKISYANLRGIVDYTATIMRTLKLLNDNVIKINGLLDELFIKTNRGPSFTKGIIKKKLREIVLEEKIQLSNKDKKIVLNYLSDSKHNIIRFFGEDINEYFSDESPTFKSYVNSFLNYISPQRVEAIEMLGRDPKASENYKSDSETLKNVNTDDVYNVCRKIIWEKTGEGKISDEDKEQIMNRMDNILRYTSKMYSKFFEDINPIRELQYGYKSREELCKAIYDETIKPMPKLKLSDNPIYPNVEEYSIADSESERESEWEPELEPDSKPESESELELESESELEPDSESESESEREPESINYGFSLYYSNGKDNLGNRTTKPLSKVEDLEPPTKKMRLN